MQCSKMMQWRCVGLAVIVSAMMAQPAMSYQRYRSGCQMCHGSFTGGISPAGHSFPQNDNHDMHRRSIGMNADCDLCHQSGDNDNPFIRLFARDRVQSRFGLYGVPRSR